MANGKTTPSTGTTVLAGASAISGLASAYASSKAAEAQGFYQAAAAQTQAYENLRMSGLRADKDVEYAELSFARKQKQIEFEAINYKIQANNLLKRNAQANASIRARAAASGIDYQGGSAGGMQERNIYETYQDVSINDLNALVSRVFGMEDATQILRAGYDSAFYTREAALSSADAANRSGQFSIAGAGLMANARLFEGAAEFAKVFPFEAAKKSLFGE
jgi:hypothetical protein